jgi:geranylgeranyl pyrophosphate synthase
MHDTPRDDDAVTILSRTTAVVEAALHALSGRHPTAPARLVEAVQYSLTAGGKRLRPALVLEAARACGGADPPGPVVVTAAVAIELVHTFSLVHDDLPAMDDDDLRRGRPTNHKVFGEAMAILAGDAMLALAFELIATDVPDAPVATALVRELSQATGPGGMIGGQVLDMAAENQALTRAQLEAVHAAKTGALLTAACRLGAIAVEASDAQRAAVTTFGRHIGLAFQIVDDVLDVTASPEELGKATHKDADRGKNTYPQLLGMAGSMAAAAEQLALGLTALGSLGAAAEGLRSLAKFVVERTK